MRHLNKLFYSFMQLVLITTVSSAATFTFLQDDKSKSAVEDTTKEKKKKERKELPLEPGRSLSFTTDEVSWMSLDVSPDGQTIVFDLLGDLYTLGVKLHN